MRGVAFFFFSFFLSLTHFPIRWSACRTPLLPNVSTGIIWRCRVFKELLRQVATKNGQGSWKLNADLMEAD
jgi:hypothetical protein